MELGVFDGDWLEYPYSTACNVLVRTSTKYCEYISRMRRPLWVSSAAATGTGTRLGVSIHCCQTGRVNHWRSALWELQRGMNGLQFKLPEAHSCVDLHGANSNGLVKNTSR